MKIDLPGIQMPDLDIWQIVLLVVALAGITLVILGWDWAWIAMLFGAGGAGARQQRKQTPAPELPDRPPTEQEEPTTEYSEAADDVEEQVAGETVDEMSDDEVLEALEEDL